MKQLLLIGTGGFVGSILRYGMGVWLLRFSLFPWGTLSVNLIGSLLIGVIVGSSIKGDQPAYWLLAIGFCGGFTTFSAFALDGIKLIREDNWIPFLLYVGISVVGGLVAVVLGMWLGNKLA